MDSWDKEEWAPQDEGADLPSRSVLNRAASIIEAFSADETVLSLGQLSQKVELPKSTVHRFAERLREIGWLERAPGGYRIGLRLYEVGALANRRRRLSEAASPHMQKLAQGTGLAVQLAVLDGSQVVYLERIPIRGFRLPTRDGGRMPAYCTGLGKAMLAFADGHDIEAVLNDGLMRRTPTTITQPSVLRDELAEIRCTSLAKDQGEAYRGVSCLAAPIRGSGRAIGAVSICGPTDRVDEKYAKLVGQVAGQVWADIFPQKERLR
jgi:DNA-binding IclR family transcriptional regulator